MSPICRATRDLPTKVRIIKIFNSPRDRVEDGGPRPFFSRNVGIVLPALDEGPNLQRLVPEIETIFSRLDIKGHLFIVDDNSHDGTENIVKELAMKYKNVTLIQRPAKLGLGSAYRLGFKQALKAKMDVIFEMDADLSHRPSYIPAFLDCMKKSDADLVIGSRYCNKGGTFGWSLSRRAISFMANVLTQIMLGVNQTRDMTSGFRTYKASTLEAIGYGSLVTNGYAWQIETLYKVHLKKGVIREIPIIFYDREIGKSKLGLEDVREFIVFLIKALVYRMNDTVRRVAGGKSWPVSRSCR
ncbi:MAG: polyprenol monophosphomannose synthase [Candidatus Sigynarchaeota archaeon]